MAKGRKYRNAGLYLMDIQIKLKRVRREYTCIMNINDLAV